MLVLHFLNYMILKIKLFTDYEIAISDFIKLFFSDFHRSP